MSERAMHLKYLCVNWRYDIYIYMSKMFFLGRAGPGEGWGCGHGLFLRTPSLYHYYLLLLLLYHLQYPTTGILCTQEYTFMHCTVLIIRT